MQIVHKNESEGDEIKSFALTSSMAPAPAFKYGRDFIDAIAFHSPSSQYLHAMSKNIGCIVD